MEIQYKNPGNSREILIRYYGIIIYGKINGIPFSQYSRFPFAFDGLFGVYIILGVGIPVLIGLISEKVKMRISRWLFH